MFCIRPTRDQNIRATIRPQKFGTPQFQAKSQSHGHLYRMFARLHAPILQAQTGRAQKVTKQQDLPTIKIDGRSMSGVVELHVQSSPVNIPSLCQVSFCKSKDNGIKKRLHSKIFVLRNNIYNRERNRIEKDDPVEARIESESCTRESITRYLSKTKPNVDGLLSAVKWTLRHQSVL
jgi:hypothetical protein